VVERSQLPAANAAAHPSPVLGLVTPHDRVADLRQLCRLPALRTITCLNLEKNSLPSAALEFSPGTRISPAVGPASGRATPSATAACAAWQPTPVTRLLYLDLRGNQITPPGCAT